MKSPRPYVLFVDDDEPNLVVFEATCAAEFSVLTAKNAEQALALMEAHTVGVLITDQRMPGTTGVALLQRARSEHPDTIRMLVTAYSDLSAAIDAINRGQVRRYLKKPWQAEELKSELADALDVFEMRRAMRNMERRLAETERLYALGVVAAGIAHELRNPLHWISGNLVAVRDALASVEASFTSGDLSAPTRLRDRLTTMTEAILDAQEGVRRIQDVVRGVELPARAPTDEEADPAEVLRLTLRIVRGETLRTADLILEVSEVPKVRGSSTKIGQIVLNLLVNALQVMSARPREKNSLRVRLWEDEGWVRLQVADNGPGIAEAHFSRVFDPFYTTRESGTGLGLAISRKIAEELGGRLDVSGREGSGAVFDLRLPAVR